MSSEILEPTRIIPIPLPYITFLLKAYFSNYVDVNRYILPQLTEVAAYSLCCIKSGNTSEMRKL
jgi:hypothetical protein